MLVKITLHCDCLQYMHVKGKGCFNQALGRHHDCISVPPPLWNVPLAKHHGWFGHLMQLQLI